MSNTAELPLLLRMINEEARLLERFLEVLAQEHQLLLAGEVDALVQLAATKTDLFHQLQRIHDDRSLRLARMGQPPGDEGVRAALGIVPAALARWDALLELAGRARDQNIANGQLITERMQHNQAALSILMAASNRPQLYGRTGHTLTGGRGRHLGSV